MMRNVGCNSLKLMYKHAIKRNDQQLIKEFIRSADRQLIVIFKAEFIYQKSYFHRFLTYPVIYKPPAGLPG